MLLPGGDPSGIKADAHVIAKSLVAPKQRKLKGAPAATDLARAITQIQYNGTMKGSNTLIIDLQDERHHILDSGLFDGDQNGQIDPVDINYPDGSRYWWRVVQVSPTSDQTIAITCMVREAIYLCHLFGPRRWNRASVTRAQALQAMALSVKEGDGIDFRSDELKKVEPVAAIQAAAPSAVQTVGTSSPSASPARAAGIGANAAGLKCKGQPLNSIQITNANVAIQVGQQLNAPTAAIVAAIYAAMGESSLGADANTYDPATNGGSVGVWQAQDPHYSNGRDTAGMANGFYTGGVDFGNGGAIALANAGHPPPQIANAVEVNAVYINSGGDSANPNASGDSYAPQGVLLSDAEAIVQAGGGGAISGGSAPGGGASTSVTRLEAYYFEVAANENYWDAGQRIAQEVDWPLFMDGRRQYYDSDADLCRQKPAAVITRGQPEIVAWNYDWDMRSIVTQFTLTLSCGMFAFRPGDVFHLKRFGAASTAFVKDLNLPGRWLIDSFQRNKTDGFTQFTLAQPVPQKPEPAPQTTTVTVPTSGGGTSIPGASLSGVQARTAEAAAVASQILSNWALHYTKYDRDLTRVGPGWPGLDCSGSTSWVLWKAGFPIPGDPHAAPVSGDYESWGDPGQGSQMTIWTNPDHIFIEFHIPGMAHMQMNTSPASDRPGCPPGDGPRFFPWGDNGQADAESGGFIARHWVGT